MKAPSVHETVILTLILAGSGVIGGLALTVGTPDPSCPRGKGIARTFTIIADLDGYNGSKLRGGMEPSMTASRCDTITIRLVNRDFQAHGLAVTFYAVNGIEVIKDDTQRITFQAVKAGVFRVYCNTQCSVHNFMQSASLTIT